jgi:hypothetical protein
VKKIKELVKKIKYIHVFWSFFYLLIFSILIHNGFSYLDPDFGWHLKVGEEINRTYEVPEKNIYNYTYTDNWVDHEWLSNYLIFHGYQEMGYPILVIIFAILIILVLIVLNYQVQKHSLKKITPYLVAVFQLLAVIAALPHFGVRIQEVALLFVLLVLTIINQYQKKQDWRILLLLPPLLYLWSCLHGSFLIGFFILFSWIFIKIFEKITKKTSFLQIFDHSEIISAKKIFYFFIFTTASFIATLITPYGPDLYNFLNGYRNNAYLSIITEWLPQSALPLHFYQLAYLAIGLTAVFLYFSSQKQKIKIWKIFLLIVFAVLSFKSRRHFPLFIVVSFGFIIEIYSNFFQEIKNSYFYLLRYLIIFCLVVVIFIQLFSTRFTNTPVESYCKDYPCAGVNFLKNNPEYLNQNIFNHYGWGGFLIWDLPNKLLFIDGRLPQVSFANWTFIEEYRDFFSTNKPVQEKLTKYNIGLVLIPQKDDYYQPKKWEKFLFTIKNQKLKPINKLREHLDGSSNWQVIYEDNVSKIYFYQPEKH